jgi:hypothetical protein
MARATIAAQSLPGPYPVLPVTPASDLTETVLVVVNGAQTTIVDGKTMVHVHNINAAAQTVTFTSSVDSQNRTGDITAYSLAAGATKLFGPFRLAGWTTGGFLYIDVGHIDVKVAVVTLP